MALLTDDTNELLFEHTCGDGELRAIVLRFETVV